MHSIYVSLSEPILSLELRPRAFGYAVFGAPAELIEYGRRKHLVANGRLKNAVTYKIATLLDTHLPSQIVMRTRHIQGHVKRRLAIITNAIRGEASRRSIKVHLISARAVRKHFVQLNCRSKYETAVYLANNFQQLAWKLPPKRKAWKTEDHRMVIFDAAATAITFLNKSSELNA